QKFGFFIEQLGIDKKYLPAKRYAGAVRERHTDRYFVDKFPMFLPPNPSSPPVVSFSFVDPGLESLDSFKTHLDAYTPLFCQLPKLNFHYIAARDTHQNKPATCSWVSSSAIGTLMALAAWSTISASESRLKPERPKNSQPPISSLTLRR